MEFDQYKKENYVLVFDSKRVRNKTIIKTENLITANLNLSKIPKKKIH